MRIDGGVAFRGQRRLELGRQEVAVLDALLAPPGRVVTRRELAQRAGLADPSSRRVDSLLVAVRRAVAPDRIVNVRRRGWRIEP